MTRSIFLHDATNIAIWFAAGSMVLFLLIYTKAGLDWGWLRSIVGRTVVALDLCLLLLLIPACVDRVVGREVFLNHYYWQLITLADFYLVGLIALSRAITFARLLRRGGPPKGDPLSSTQVTTSEYPNTPTP